MRTILWIFAAAAGLICVDGVALADTVAPSEPALAAAVRDYLEDHGDLCVDKVTWPRDVTEADRQAGSNDALQLPVLERLGLVKSVDVSPAVNPAGTEPAVGSESAGQTAPVRYTKRYSLTAKGRRYYLRKKTIILGAHDQPVERDGDFCVAHLSLDKVVRWSLPTETRGHLETVVSYTYKIKAADWMAKTEASKAFPVVDRIIRGEGNLQMAATLQAQNGRWVPVLPGQ